jgi:hypothetical protein
MGSSESHPRPGHTGSRFLRRSSVFALWNTEVSEILALFSLIFLCLLSNLTGADIPATETILVRGSGFGPRDLAKAASGHHAEGHTVL